MRGWMVGVVVVIGACGAIEGGPVMDAPPDPVAVAPAPDLGRPRNAHYCRDEATRANCIGMFEHGAPPDLGRRPCLTDSQCGEPRACVDGWCVD